MYGEGGGGFGGGKRVLVRAYGNVGGRICGFLFGRLGWEMERIGLNGGGGDLDVLNIVGEGLGGGNLEFVGGRIKNLRERGGLD